MGGAQVVSVLFASDKIAVGGTKYSYIGWLQCNIIVTLN